MKFPLTRRKNSAPYHSTLDPYKDRGQIIEQLIAHEFPVDFLLAAEIAQLRSFSIPNGAKLLHRTGEFEKNSLKRLDDTRAILVEMGREGFESDKAKMMANHLNQLHGFYQIPNDEFLYTLSTFIFDVVLFIDKYGWRKLTAVEKESLYYTYRDMGQLMKIENIPPSYEAFWEWRCQYEKENQAFAEENHLVAEGLFRGAKEMVPWIIRPLVKPFVFSLEDDHFAEVLGYKRPNIFIRAFFQAVMAIRKFFLRYLTLWDVWSFEEMLLSNFKTYPRGYKLLKLGPTKLIKQLEKQAPYPPINND